MSDLYTLRLHGHGLSAGPVLKARDAATLDGAEALIRSAEAEASRIRAEARQVYEAEKQRGLAEGQAQAARDAAARLAGDSRALDQALARMEGEIARLIISALREIISDFDRPELARGTARTALATMRSEKRVRLHAAPDMIEDLRKALPAIKEDYPEVELIDLISDAKLSTPDLRIESGLGVVTFALDDTLTTLRALLTGG
ncbi:type III secretion system stator protein SctL [Pseudooceanicola aestuarii]|uniref:type III secretion system stator protein SctL n=1 Tax=Pseudooceanicola aestuarii TaxID=2697319 RepID=UPI0013D572F0|nr:type III secretion system stator protein SctL [Pseudooceanicola aestuarii]